MCFLSLQSLHFFIEFLDRVGSFVQARRKLVALDPLNMQRHVDLVDLLITRLGEWFEAMEHIRCVRGTVTAYAQRMFL
jgi:hypothetical protein